MFFANFRDYLRENEIFFAKLFLPLHIGLREGVFLKDKGSKISWHCPFKVLDQVWERQNLGIFEEGE